MPNDPNNSIENADARILIIDDNEEIHRDFDQILAKPRATPHLDDLEASLFGASASATTTAATRRYIVHHAYQGQEGLAMLEKALAEGTPYLLAIVDMRMPPGWDGMTTIEHLWHADPFLQIVICTAYADHSCADILSRVGDRDNLLILKKPFDPIEAIQIAGAMTRKWLIEQKTRERAIQLEAMAADRTYELLQANQTLQMEIAERHDAELALARNQTLLRQVLDSDPNLVSVKNASGQYIFANKALADIFQTVPADMEGKTDFDFAEAGFITYSDASAFAETDTHVLKTQQPTSIADETMHLAGCTRHFQTIKLPIQLQHSDTSVLVVSTDITTTMQTQSQLKRQKELLDNILSNIPSSVFWKDTVHRYLGCNTHFARLAGLTDPSQILSKTDHDLPWSADEVKQILQADETVFQSGEPILNMEETRTCAGGIRPVLLTSRVPLKDSDGNLIGLIGISNDITERKQMESRLQTTQAAVDHATEALIISDWDGRVQYINAAGEELLGHTIGSLDQCGVATLLANMDTAAEVFSTVRDFHSWSGEVKAINADGEIFTAFLRATPILDEQVGVIGQLYILNDITEQKKLQSQLMQASKLESIGQLAAGIAHEINTPTQYIGDNIQFLKSKTDDLLAIINIYNDLIAKARTAPITDTELDDVEKRVKDLDVEFICEELPSAIGDALEGVTRVSNIVRAMKEFSHPGVEGRSAIDLNHAIENTAIVARNRWKYVADLEFDFDSTLPLVHCYANEINQVILNVIVNAADAIAEAVGTGSSVKGKIVICTRQLTDWVEIRISDTGSGIPPAIQQRIFDPFFTTKTVGKGTGQGLSISYTIITDKHHGSLSFETNVGKGTTFIIRLPIENQTSAESMEPSSHDAEPDAPAADDNTREPSLQTANIAPVNASATRTHSTEATDDDDSDAAFRKHSTCDTDNDADFRKRNGKSGDNDDNDADFGKRSTCNVDDVDDGTFVPKF